MFCPNQFVLYGGVPPLVRAPFGLGGVEGPGSVQGSWMRVFVGEMCRAFEGCTSGVGIG